jgi:tetratricopeptide (TPR) repeat protein
MFQSCADLTSRLRTVWATALPMLLAVTYLSGCGSAPAKNEIDAAKASDASPQTQGSGTPRPATIAESPEAKQRFERAVTLLNSGDTAKAEQELRALGEAYPQYSGPSVNLGILQMKAGKLADAEATLKQAVDRNPQNAQAHNELGIVYRREGKFTDADGAYQRAIEIAPDYALAHLNLGVLCDLYLQQPARALEEYEKYLSLTDTPAPQVTQWVAELKARTAAAQRAAGSGT